MKSRTFGLALFGAVSLPAIAFAQSSAPKPPAEAEATQPPTGASVQTVIVTARKRSEALQEVPAAITALTSATLEHSNIVSLSQVGGMAPNVYFEKVDPSIPFLYIRGIGSRNFDPGTDEPNGVFIDGVYQAFRGSFDADLFDVNQVEILHGPQGTLYGKDTIGGAISITTKDPTDTFHAGLMADGGGGATPGSWLYDIGGQVSGPIANGVSGYFSVVHRDNNGWSSFSNPAISERGGSNVETDEHAKLVFDLGSSAVLRLNASYIDQDAAPLAYSLNTYGGTLAPIPLAPGIAQPAISPNPYQLDAFYNGYTKKQIPSFSANLTWDLPGVTITSISAYQSEKLFYIWDQAGENLPAFESDIGERDQEVSEELRATGSASKVFGASDSVKWLLGVFVDQEVSHRFDTNFWEPASLFAFLNGTPFTSVVYFNKRTVSAAVFGQLDYKVTNRLTLTLGGRFSDDRSNVNYQQTNTSSNAFATAFATPYQLTLPQQRWMSFDPTATVKYQIAPKTMAYFTFDSGYKAGAFQYAAGTAATASIVANPEHVKSYELGLKSTLFDNRLQFDADVFYMDYKDLQVLTFVRLPQGNIEPATSNAASSTISGAEFQTQFAVNENWRVGLNMSTLHAVYDKYISPNGNFSGDTLPFSPRVMVNLSVDYQKDLSFGHFDGNLSYNWRDSVFETPDNNKEFPESSEGPVGLLNADFSITRGSVKYSLWGTNLVDDRYRALVIDVAGLAQRQLWAAPRTIGIRVNFKL